MPPLPHRPASDPRCHHCYTARHQVPDATIATPLGIRFQMPPLPHRQVSDPRCHHHHYHFAARHQIPDATIAMHQATDALYLACLPRSSLLTYSILPTNAPTNRYRFRRFLCLPPDAYCLQGLPFLWIRGGIYRVYLRRIKQYLTGYRHRDDA